jgi:eukaryotic-like serine/threonine-protein kinase
VRLPRGFGPFELTERLGAGGMAEVFKATAFGASGFEKTVALKLLREEYVGEPSWERMFLDEARLQARLSHRGLVQAHDFGSVEGRPWVRLDFVDGLDLAALADGRAVPTSIASFIIAEVLTALAALHDAVDEHERPLGLVHRDVSATNVLVSKRGEVKLGDFGIAKATLLKDQTHGGIRKGSYAYMSPEQVAGRPLTAASDVFSAAVLAVELLTGVRPFDAATPVETMERIREATRPSLDTVPEALRSTVSTMLQLDPSTRGALPAHVANFHGLADDEFRVATWARDRIHAVRAVSPGGDVE